MSFVTCEKCKHKWYHKGLGIYAMCPKCHYSMRVRDAALVRENKVEEEEPDDKTIEKLEKRQDALKVIHFDFAMKTLKSSIRKDRLTLQKEHPLLSNDEIDKLIIQSVKYDVLTH